MNRFLVLGLFLALGLAARLPSAASVAPTTAASTALPGFGAGGVLSGNRFECGAGAAWKGDPAAAGWWWQVRFPEPRAVGALLQIQGDDPLRLRNAPRKYVWQGSLDGKNWRDLKETQTDRERRTFRIHRLKRAVQVQYLRLVVREAEGGFPTLRAAEFFAEPSARIDFPAWSVVVSTTTRYEPMGHGAEFIPLARQSPGWEGLQAQQVWLESFDEAFVAAEPRPLCAFLSGSFRDWCEVERAPWRGAQEILRRGRLPIWASCGGAQGLAILAETGVEREWDCPHCRDPKRPKLPIYTHVGHTARKPCGDYSACLFERGPTAILQAAHDPVFAGLPREFPAMESHCGQIEWAPRGWTLVAVGGKGARTRTQCLRVRDRPIYAAQFHIEMAGTPETSRRIMTSFLEAARAWGGYNPSAAPLPPPAPWRENP